MTLFYVISTIYIDILRGSYCYNVRGAATQMRNILHCEVTHQIIQQTTRKQGPLLVSWIVHTRWIISVKFKLIRQVITPAESHMLTDGQMDGRSDGRFAPYHNMTDFRQADKNIPKNLKYCPSEHLHDYIGVLLFGTNKYLEINCMKNVWHPGNLVLNNFLLFMYVYFQF